MKIKENNKNKEEVEKENLQPVPMFFSIHMTYLFRQTISLPA